MTFSLNLVPPPLNFCSRSSTSLEFADTARRFVGSFSVGGNFYSLPPTLCHVSAQVCFPLWSGYRHSVRPVGLPKSFPRFARCIGHTNIFSPCWAVLPKYPARCKVSSLSVIFSFVKRHRLESSCNNAHLLH